MLVFWTFRALEQMRLMKAFGFFGRNSMVVLGIHGLVFYAFNAVVVKILGLFESADAAKLSPPYALTLFGVVVDYLAIKFFNRYMPWAVGKRTTAGR